MWLLCADAWCVVEAQSSRNLAEPNLANDSV